MSIGTMTSKGQITIPKEVREDLRLTPGTKVIFTRQRDGEYVLTTGRPKLAHLAGSLKYQGPIVSLAEMEEAITAGAGQS